jgi:2-phospho-L-lactate guanylyltransferase
MLGVDSAVVVPIKAFHAAKARLAAALGAQERAALARRMAATVLAAGAPLDRFVVCDDDEVAEFAVANHAKVLWMPDRGLNGAVEAGVAEVGDAGYDHVVVAHSDLPLATRLPRLATAGTVTLVPDRHGDGTNVIALPTALAFPFQYGPASFRHHSARAADLGVDLRVVRDPRLALDVDRPDDLRHPLLDGWIER